MKEYWFARRFPVGNPRNAMAPVTWQGWAVAGAFFAAMFIGGLAFLWMALNGALVQGLIVFVVAAIVGGGWFIGVALTKGDKTRTVEDYRKVGRA